MRMEAFVQAVPATSPSLWLYLHILASIDQRNLHLDFYGQNKEML